MALLAVLAFAVSAWGWGRMVLRACGLEAQSGLVHPVVLGLAALAAIGGWLNVFALAYLPTLWGLLLIGWLAAARRIYAAGLPVWRIQRRSDLLYGGVVALAALSLGLAVLPAGAFNPWDDFQFYITRPVRMLQVGTFGHDPFDSLGLESLGTQAFLQAFTLLAFEPAFLNAFDAVLCAALSLGLVAAIGRRLEIHPAVCLGALLALLLLHPQQVNISALYSIAMFSLAVVPAGAQLADARPSSSVPRWSAALPMGLLFAAIAGSKATTVTILISLPSLLVLLFGLTYGWRFALHAAGKVAALATVFVSPWLVLSADKYLQWTSERTDRVWLGPVTNPLRLLTDDVQLYWGGTVRIYTVIAAFILAVTAFALFTLRRRKEDSSSALRTPLIALCAAAVLTYILNTVPHDLRHTVRYSIPMLLAALPSAVLLGGWLLAGSGGGRRPGARTAAALIFACAVPLTLAILFAAATKDRVWNAVTYRSLLAFPKETMKGCVVLTRYAWSLGVEMGRGAQARVEPGERILALIAYPHNLLFVRNPIYVAYDGALFWPWLDIPQNADGEEMRRFLRSYGIRYVMWQRAGPAVKSDAEIRSLLDEDSPALRDAAKRALSFRRSMSDMVADAPQDMALLVVDLGKAPAAARR